MFCILLLKGQEVTIDAQKVIVHSLYNDNDKDYDIAMVKLKNPVEFNDFIKPVCLPDVETKFVAGKFCTVTGFGALAENGPQTRKLQQANVPLVDFGQCKRKYRGLTDRMLCAGYDQGRIDSCQGDSGGPLVCSQGGKYFLAGVVSYGKGCARRGYPGVYANVSNLKSWIDKIRKQYED